MLSSGSGLPGSIPTVSKIFFIQKWNKNWGWKAYKSVEFGIILEIDILMPSIEQFQTKVVDSSNKIFSIYFSITNLKSESIQITELFYRWTMV